MRMHNPPHPGEFIRKVYTKSLGISHREIAAKLKFAPHMFNRLIKGQSNFSSEMALRLSKTLGCSPESWLIMQNNNNIWVANKIANLDEVEELALPK